MAGFIRGAVLIGAMALYSPVHLGNDAPNWTESAKLISDVGQFAASATTTATPLNAKATEALVSLARENGPALAKKLAELDPETRRMVMDMSIAAANQMQGASAKVAGESKPKP
ncbi:MAG: hypothetical protein ACRCWO_11390 [Bosea sp. (in: a-proteobacteria)]